MEAAVRKLLRFFGVSIGLAVAVGWAAWQTGVAAQAGPLRVEVSVPASAGSQPVDGRVLLMLSTDPSGEPRFQINDDVKTQQVFGVDVDGLAPGKAAVFDAAALGYPVASLDQIPPGTYTVQALLHRYETLPPRRRPHGETPDGPWRGPAVEPRAGQSLQRAPDADDRPEAGRDRPSRPRPGDSADPRSSGHEVHQARPHPERSPDEVLGPAHVPRRERAAAGRLGHAPAGAVSARHQPRALSRTTSTASATRRPTRT